jgi:hypothetical protein
MFELFAQVQRNPRGNGPPPGANEAVLAGVLGFYCVFFLLAIAAFICQIVLYMRMSQTLQAISKRNRKTEPGLVWLNLIPGVALVWLILCVLWIADSLKAEYEDRDLPGDGDYGKTIGIIYYALTLLCFPIGLIALFMYRTKLGTYLDELSRSGQSPGRRRRDEDPYDDESEDRR